MNSKFDHPTIILIGKEGVGKSTVGNMLFGACNDSEDKRPFETFDGAYDGDERSRQHFKTAELTINNEKFIIVDTPGLRREENISESNAWKEINRAIDASDKCGVQAFLLILQQTRFTADIISHVNECINKLKNKNIIIVFTKCSKSDTKNSKNMENLFSNYIKELVEKVHGWVISPNTDIFNESVVASNLVASNMNRLKMMISEIEQPWKNDKVQKPLLKQLSENKIFYWIIGFLITVINKISGIILLVEPFFKFFYWVVKKSKHSYLFTAVNIILAIILLVEFFVIILIWVVKKQDSYLYIEPYEPVEHGTYGDDISSFWYKIRSVISSIIDFYYIFQRGSSGFGSSYNDKFPSPY